MTTPHQRTRSVLQARQLLSRLLSSPGLPIEVQAEARRLLRHYPEAWHLSRLHDRLPEDWGDVAAVQDEVPGQALDPH